MGFRALLEGSGGSSECGITSSPGRGHKRLRMAVA